MGPTDGERKRSYLEGHALKDLKNDLDQVMREVDELENPNGSDFLENRWDEYNDNKES
jgi:hypothetical protein